MKKCPPIFLLVAGLALLTIARAQLATNNIVPLLPNNGVQTIQLTTADSYLYGLQLLNLTNAAGVKIFGTNVMISIMTNTAGCDIDSYFSNAHPNQVTDWTQVSTFIQLRPH